jgi:hypothetical protein
MSVDALVIINWNFKTHFEKNTKHTKHFNNDMLEFPLVIEHLDTAKEAIGDCREFIVKTKAPFTYINYKRVMTSTFPPLTNTTDDKELYMRRVRRELRGLVFNCTSGELVARSMHKFFNLNEREESSIDYVQKLVKEKELKVVVMEKLDGSLANPLMVPTEDPLVKHIRFRTKMGFDNDHTDTIESILFGTHITSVAKFIYDPETKRHTAQYSPDITEKGRKLLDFCLKWLDDGYTLLFEFFAREHRVVVDYDEPFLSLLAIRHTREGYYVDYHEMVQDAKLYDIQHVKELDVSAFTHNPDTVFKDLVNYAHGIEYVEGYVIRINNKDNTFCEMYKTKTKWYNDIHRVKELVALNNMPEHYVWALVIDNTVDDALPTMHREEHRERLIAFNDNLSQAIEDCVQESQEYLERARAASITSDNTYDMKLFAQYILKEVTPKRGNVFAQSLFKLQKELTPDSEKTVEDIVCEILKGKVKNSVVESQRYLNKPDLKFYKDSDTKITKLHFVSKRRQKELELQQQMKDLQETKQEMTDLQQNN